MAKVSIWADNHVLSATIRQMAIDNGTPNVMPTLEQMSETPGLATWVRKKEGGVNKLSQKLNMVVKPNVLPPTKELPVSHHVLKGATVFVHNKTSIYPAIVLDKGEEPGSLIVLTFNKRLNRRRVKYGTVPSKQYQWCYGEDVPRERIAIAT